MTSERTSLRACLLLGALTLGLAATARAQEAPDEATITRAQQLFGEAEEAYEAHRYATAARLFRQVHALMEGHPRQHLVLFNLGQCLADAGEYDEAIEVLRRYLDEGGAAIENRGEVEARIAQLEELRGEGGAPPTAPEPSGPDEGLMTGSIVAFGVGGAGLVAMGVFGGLAIAEHESLADGCGATTSCTEDDVATGDAFALAADVALGVGAAGLATGVALLVAALSSGGDGEDRAELPLSPWVSANGAGAVGRATF
ncbi:MAG TPA: tetratricopeptide repeat protein [Sandaracinaceae bacterium LLY-WYZ-13_1]|nr:tetratricopeptide repeat protein [Sandaracinaceae bacterium LLY-WYZ-13_1]